MSIGSRTVVVAIGGTINVTKGMLRRSTLFRLFPESLISAMVKVAIASLVGDVKTP